MTLDIQVYCEFVSIEKTLVPRPKSISVKQWLEFWEFSKDPEGYEEHFRKQGWNDGYQEGREQGWNDCYQEGREASVS